MKRSLLTLSLCFFLFGLLANAQEKIVTVNVKLVMDSYYKKRQMVDMINSSATEKSRALDSRKATYKKLTSEMVKIDRMINDPSRAAQSVADLRQKLIELSATRDSTAADISSATRRAEQQILEERQKIENNLTSDIQQMVAKVAKAKGYDLAFDSSFLPNTSYKSLVYSSDKVPDITDDVIANLNASAPSSP